LTLVIHAPNIHIGGGRTLLLALLSTVRQPTVVQLDERFGPMPDLDPGVRVIRVAPSLIGRLQAERRLQLLCRGGDLLLCFGNLPPLFRSPARVFVYLQNRYLTSSRPVADLPWSARLRIRIERLWLRHRLRNAILLVQTETMSQEVRESFGCEASVLPFFPREVQPSAGQLPVLYDYLYVASGEPHKNHRRLLQAWILLANRGFRPSLCLTLDTQRDAALCAWVERLVRQHGLRVANNPVPPSQISGLYAQCGALIYPSLFESFGLPLLEARRVGMSIVAAERDYVRDVVTPVVSFDPESALSIARAVMRYQGWWEEPAMPGDVASFLERLAESG
jgi:glycosyltransferase involved in cell wall biosynthesis